MKLDTDNIVIERSNIVADEFEFGIKNPAIVFEILCTKLYENPLQVLIQEYMCNARDSHRENGNTLDPIEVVLPTKLFPTIKFRDSGVGLSPDRVKDVFVFLGESTKNTNDFETGGFGVGAKTGWAYTDSFTVRTIYNGIEYVYLAYMAETRIGKLESISQTSTDKSNGTTIEVDIKPEDFDRAELYVYRTGHFWEVRPVVKNNRLYKFNDTTINYHDKHTNELLGSCIKNVGNIPYLTIDSNKINLVLDGIIYNSVTDYIILPEKCNIISTYNNGIYIHFNISELKPSINRKNVMITKKSTECIINKIIKFVDNITYDFTKTIKLFKTLGDLIEYIKVFDVSSLIVLKSWEFTFLNYKISYNQNDKFHIDIPRQYFIVNEYTYSSKNNILKFSKTLDEINISHIINQSIIINDKFTKTFNRDAIKTYMKSGSINLNRIYIIQPHPYEDKEEIITECTDFINIIDNYVLKLSEITKKYKSTYTYGSGVRQAILSGKIRDHADRLISVDINDYFDDCDYFIDELSEPLTGYSVDLQKVIKHFNLLKTVTFKIIRISDAVRRKIKNSEDYEDKIITPNRAIEIILDYLEKNIDFNEHITRIHVSLDLPYGVSIFNRLHSYTKLMNDKKFANTIDNIIKFNNKINKLDSKSIDLKSKVYNILINGRYNRDKQVTTCDMFKTNMLKNIIKRKEKIFNNEITVAFEKYPLLSCIKNTSVNMDNFIDYINVYYEKQLN